MCHSSKVQPKEMGDTQLDSTNIKQEFPLPQHDLCPNCLTSKDRIFEHTCATSECHFLQSGNCPEQRLDSMVKESKYRKAKGVKHELLSCRCKKRQGSPHQKGLLIL